MKLIIFAVVVAACAAKSTKSEWENHTCGGAGGRQQWTDAAYVMYGPIRGFELWHGSVTCVLDGIRLKYGEVWGPKHNGGGRPKVSVEFRHKEEIVAIDMDTRNHWGYQVLCKLTIFTNERVLGPYCNHKCSNNRCGLPKYGEYKYISGRHGGNLDSLTWHV